MFGRKKKIVEDDIEDDEVVEDDDEVVAEDDAEATGEDEAEEEEEQPPLDKWQVLDASRDWREDGPFDIAEVDLDADDIERLDFGSLVVTPFDGIKLQMQVNQASDKVQSLLVIDGKSAIEVALFAAPAHSSMLPEVREQMQKATDDAGGTMQLVKGPLGTEVRRRLTPEGEKVAQASRAWLVQGPRWLLRGVVMGPAAAVDGIGTGEAQMLFEFFCNLVVRRGDSPMVPGEVISLEQPESTADKAPAKGGKRR